MSINRLYHNARVAFEGWSSLAVKDRVKYLKKLRLVIVDNLDHLVTTISDSTGKVPVEAITTEVLTVLDSIVFLEQNAIKSLVEQKVTTPCIFVGKKSYIHYQPRGVVLVISPWNFPFLLSLIPALNAAIAGNAVIIKPSEVTPKIGIVIENLITKAGFPEHVFQIAHGDHSVGAKLVANKPDFIFFTGSVATGKKIQIEAAKHLIPTILELGGKDPMVVFADANLQRAVNGALWGGFTNSGQVCMAVERLFVHRSIYPVFTKLLLSQLKLLDSGICDNSDNSDIGRMTSLRQYQIVKEHIEDALAKGAQMLAGEDPSEWDASGEPVISPVVLTEITPDMLIWHEETFGPVLPIIPFDSEEQVLQLCNQLEFGLSASLWTKNITFARDFASKLVVGNIMINDVITSIANPYLPFGGTKDSGIGKYHGYDGLRVFTNQISVMIDSGNKKSEINWYPYKGKYKGFKQLISGYYGVKKDLPSLLKATHQLFTKKK